METELYPRLSGRDEANAEIDIAEKELSEGKGIKEMENLPLQTGQSSIALW